MYSQILKEGWSKDKRSAATRKAWLSRQRAKEKALQGEKVGSIDPKHPYTPNVEADSDRNGVTDAARVGVPGDMVPPEPAIPRLPNLNPRERAVEEKFAKDVEADPDKAADAFLEIVKAGKKPPTFGTDDAKLLTKEWTGEPGEERSARRATLNTALHQTANAVAKRAFLKHLDTLKEGDEVFVTVGGCGAGKGYSLGNVPAAKDVAGKAKAVWDSAGDQNATENPWIQKEAEKRGLKVTYAYVHADPEVSWADPSRGVIQRAKDPNDGRMVDAKIFADSYAIGGKNHAAFAEANKNNANAKFIYIDSSKGKPTQVDKMPSGATMIDRKRLTEFAIQAVKDSDAPSHIKEGSLAGERIWGDTTVKAEKDKPVKEAPEEVPEDSPKAKAKESPKEVPADGDEEYSWDQYIADEQKNREAMEKCSAAGSMGGGLDDVPDEDAPDEDGTKKPVASKDAKTVAPDGDDKDEKMTTKAEALPFAVILKGKAPYKEITKEMEALLFDMGYDSSLADKSFAPRDVLFRADDGNLYVYGHPQDNYELLSYIAGDALLKTHGLPTSREGVFKGGWTPEKRSAATLKAWLKRRSAQNPNSDTELEDLIAVGGKKPKVGPSKDPYDDYTGEEGESKPKTKPGKHETYFESHSAAMQDAHEQIKEKGYEISDDEWQMRIASVKKPGEGKTNSYDIQLQKDGKDTDKYAHVQVYNRGYNTSKSFELNVYVDSGKPKIQKGDIEMGILAVADMLGTKEVKKGEFAISSAAPATLEVALPAEGLQGMLGIQKAAANCTPAKMPAKKVVEKSLSGFAADMGIKQK